MVRNAPPTGAGVDLEREKAEAKYGNDWLAVTSRLVGCLGLILVS